MAFDAAQILRQTYAAGAEATRFADLAQELRELQPASVQTGSLNGVAFAVEADPAAELLDSMEELSFQFEEKAAKKIADRKMGELQGPRTALIKAIETWLATFPDMPGREFVSRMAKFLRDGMAGGSIPDSTQLLRELSRGSTDPSHQFAMLDILEQSFGEGEEALAAAVRRAKADLMEARGPEIRAGVNLAAEVNARAATPEQMQELRDMYRSEVGGFTTPQECFRSLVASRGPSGLADAISFLIAGCGADLKAAAPSMEPAALGRILTDLGCVHALQTLFEKLGLLGTRMQAQFGERVLLDAQQMTGRVVDFTEQPFVASSAIAAFVAECGLAGLLARMDFTRELTRLFRQLSPRLFAKEGDRQRLVEAAQDHLDGLVAEESEMEDAI